MAATAAVLIASTTVPATNTVFYTAALTTQIANLTLTNPSAAPVTVTLYLVPQGGSAGATTQISLKPLNINETWPAPEWIGKIMAKGDTLVGTASTGAAVVISASGTQFS